MSAIIPDPLWVYRIIHYKNLAHILQNGICVREHDNFDQNYVNIGNTEIINVRDDCNVRINGYGNIGNYVPFYFGKQSIMLYNILTGYNVKKQLPEDIIYLCCRVDKLIAECSRFFFTDGQGNKEITEHFSKIEDLSKLDWNTINGTDFKKSEDDFDKPRRYQAEFLIYNEVPVKCIGGIVVYNTLRKAYIETMIKENNLTIPVKTIKNNFYFHF